MKIYSEILGNVNAAEWRERVAESEVEYLDIDSWSAQKSRFVIMRPDRGSCAVALARRRTVADGDIVEYDPDAHRMVVLRIAVADVMVADLEAWSACSMGDVVRRAVELGHAIGNQHWPAVVKGMKLYVPLTVDRKVMESVMRTHNLEGVRISFEGGGEIIPYLAPHEIRRLFAASEPAVHHHHEH